MTPENLRKQHTIIFNSLCGDFPDNFTEIISKIIEIELYEEEGDCSLWTLNMLSNEWWAIVDEDDREAYLFMDQIEVLKKWDKYKNPVRFGRLRVV